ncbi:hypothetical protein B0H12DRAFT_1077780 [Mycena haematopus]|nr:hypothetical protein B0H12DRAFT_1077780 [Mycena haematopus]
MSAAPVLASASNFAARFLAPLAAACELFGGGSSYATVLLLVVDTPYFTKWMRNNDVWYYTNYVDQLLLIDIESGNANHMLLPSSLMTHLCNAQIPPKEILQWLHLLAHLRMYAAMSRSVRKISKKKRCSVGHWALCAKNQSARALYGGSAGAYDKVLISGYIFSRPFLTVSNKAIISIANFIREGGSLPCTGVANVCTGTHIPWKHCGLFEQHCHEEGLNVACVGDAKLRHIAAKTTKNVTATGSTCATGEGIQSSNMLYKPLKLFNKTRPQRFQRCLRGYGKLLHGAMKARRAMRKARPMPTSDRRLTDLKPTTTRRLLRPLRVRVPEGEERASFAQLSAGGISRYADNGRQTVDELAEGSPEEYDRLMEFKAACGRRGLPFFYSISPPLSGTSDISKLISPTLKQILSVEEVTAQGSKICHEGAFRKRELKRYFTRQTALFQLEVGCSGLATQNIAPVNALEVGTGSAGGFTCAESNDLFTWRAVIASVTIERVCFRGFWG